jgi:hypothetical protein
LKWQIPTNSNYEWIGYRLLVDDEKFKDQFNTRNSNKISKSDKNDSFLNEEYSPNSSYNSDKKDTSINEWENVLNFSLSKFVDWDMKKE